MRRRADSDGRTAAASARIDERQSNRDRQHGNIYTAGRVTSDVHARLAAHNSGKCSHTAKAGPWELDVVVTFSDERRAMAFERYLKSGSGNAFAKRHFR
jgi:predicted GIY-YIG superfamily endonuclease